MKLVMGVFFITDNESLFTNHYSLFLHFNHHFVLAFQARNDGAIDDLSIYGNLLYAFLPSFWVLHYDVVFATTELAGYLVFMGGAWQTWVDVQSLVIRFDAEDELRHGVPHPGGCTR